VNRRFVLCAYGITAEGAREMLSFRQAHAESEAQWEAFLRDLYGRGLRGDSLALIATDGCPGLHKALETVYPYIPKQRCWAHKLRNVANHIRRKDQRVCLKGARSCPPEDCGGIWGYANLLKILQDPTHKEYEEWKTWLPEDFDPERCDLEEINSGLSMRQWTIAHPSRKRRRKKV